MKILVFSDSHGKLNNLKLVLKKFKDDVKYIIHLGDYDRDISELKPYFQCYEFINISGNCDFDIFLPSEKFFSLYNKNFFITHGHRYNVKSNLVKLSYSAEEKNADICLFGHTHIPVLTLYNNIMYMNPGSISSPRGGTSCTYGVIYISDKGNIDAEIKEFAGKEDRNIMTL